MQNDQNLHHLFERCVEQNADSIYRVAFRLTGGGDMAAELVQETYLNAWKGLKSLQDPEKMRAWIFAILRNQYSKLRRKLPPMTSLPEDAWNNVAQKNDPPRDLEQFQLQTAIDQLEDQHKLPLLLVSMEGLSVEAAAIALDIPRGTVLSRLHRGRAKLKVILERTSSQTHGS